MITPLDPLSAVQTALKPFFEQHTREIATKDEKIRDLSRQLEGQKTEFVKTKAVFDRQLQEKDATGRDLTRQIIELKEVQARSEASNRVLVAEIDGLKNQILELTDEKEGLEEKIEGMDDQSQEINRLRAENKALSKKMEQIMKIISSNASVEASEGSSNSASSGQEEQESVSESRPAKRHRVAVPVEDERLQRAEEGVREHRNNPKAHFALGFNHVRLKNYDAALNAFAEAENRKFDDWQLYYYRAISHRELKDFQSAIEAIEIAIGMAPSANQGNVIYLKATILRDSGSKAAARGCISEIKRYGVNTEKLEATLR